MLTDRCKGLPQIITSKATRFARLDATIIKVGLTARLPLVNVVELNDLMQKKFLLHGSSRLCYTTVSQ